MPVDPETITHVCLALHVRRAARRLSKRYDEALAPHGLDISQFNLLSAVAALDAAPLTAVAEVLDVDPSTLSRTVKPLRDQNLLLIDGGRGRGGLTLSLSERGFNVLMAAIPAWKAAQGDITAAVGGAEVGRLLDALENLARATKPSQADGL